jgi:hypothetical protein
VTLGQKQAAALTWGPIVWAIGFQTNYLLATSYCEKDSKVWMHAIVFAVVAAAIAGFWNGWSVWSDLRTAGGERSAFLGAMGALFNILILCLALAQWVPIFWFAPCGH